MARGNQIRNILKLANLGKDQTPPVIREGNKIVINRMDIGAAASSFNKSINSCLSTGHGSIEIDYSQVKETYPNAAVPIATRIDQLKEQGVRLTFIGSDSFADRTKFTNPTEISEAEQVELQKPLNRVWGFRNASEIDLIVKGFGEEISSNVNLEGNGVLNALDWALFEVMDNVMIHSGLTHGFVMGQIHKNSKHLAFTIADRGVGIFNSLRKSQHKPKTALDAISLAVSEGITWDESKGQGNGLWGLHQIIRLNRGSLTIISHGAGQIFTGGSENNFTVSSNREGWAIIDIQLDYDKPISLEEALGGHRPTNIRIAAMKEGSGAVRYKIKEKTQGTGTRQAGESVRNDVLNIIAEGEHVILDFEGVNIVSSSFADELLGKLVSELGFTGFNNHISIQDANDLVETIVFRSVSQRMTSSAQSGLDDKS